MQGGFGCSNEIKEGLEKLWLSVDFSGEEPKQALTFVEYNIQHLVFIKELNISFQRTTVHHFVLAL